MLDVVFIVAVLVDFPLNRIEIFLQLIQLLMLLIYSAVDDIDPSEYYVVVFMIAYYFLYLFLVLYVVFVFSHFVYFVSTRIENLHLCCCFMLKLRLLLLQNITAPCLLSIFFSFTLWCYMFC